MKQTSQTLIDFCRILSDLNVHDGNLIGQELSVSRTAIWKYVKKLQSYGIPIHSIKSKGYQLESPLLLIDQEKIHPQSRQKLSFNVFESIGSTNDYLLNQPTSNDEIQICIAEQQTKGRGRFGKTWYAPFGQNIYASIALKPEIDITELGGLSLAIGLAICHALESVCQFPKPLQLKWPNDIFYDGKKLGGILIEVQAEANGQCRLIAGIGINVNMSDAPQHQISDQNWTSIAQITKIYHDRNLIVTSLITHSLSAIEIYQKEGLSPFKEKWQQRDFLFNKSIELMSGKQKTKGIASGINDHGYLVLKLENDTYKTFASGESSIIKR